MKTDTLSPNLKQTAHLKIIFDSHDVENYFSRTLNAQNTKEFVYFARYGKSFDGHKFARQIIDSQNFIVGEKTRIQNLFQNLEEQNFILNSSFFISVDHIENALKQELKTRVANADLNFTSVGVTGTSGKTSVVQLTGQILSLSSRGSTTGSSKLIKIGSMGIEIGESKFPNSHVTTPDYPTFLNALRQAKKMGTNTLVMEVTSHGLQENRVDDYQFDVCVFTNFSQDHLDFHQTMSQYFSAKKLLFSKHLKHNGTAIVSTHSPEWIDIVKSSLGRVGTLYLLLDENDDSVFEQIKHFDASIPNIFFLKIENKQSALEGLSGFFVLMDKNKNRISRHSFSSTLMGDANFENLMCVFCICVSLGHPIETFVSHFSALKGIPGRMQRIGLPSDVPCVIVDYSHKPDGLEKILKTLRKSLKEQQRLITVFGCGGDRDALKRPVMGKIATTLSDVTIITSDNPRTENPQHIIDQIVSGIQTTQQESANGVCREYRVETDRRAAIERAFQIAEKSDMILIAGRGNETHQIIGTKKIPFSDVDVATTLLYPLKMKL